MYCAARLRHFCTKLFIRINSPYTFFSPSLRHISQFSSTSFQPPFDLDKLNDQSFVDGIRSNLLARNSLLDLDQMLDLYKRYKNGEHDALNDLLGFVKQLPNSTHPSTPVGDASKARTIYIHGTKPTILNKYRNALALTEMAFPSTECDFPSVIKPMSHLRVNNVAAGAGSRTYYFGGPLAQLESALVSCALNRLKEVGFAQVTVPDILPDSIIEACGFPTKGTRSQVYKISSSKGPVTYCLSGTSEMALAGFCAGRLFDTSDDSSANSNSAESTVLGLCAASRCFRQEISAQESPLYRVHQFTKVEMFGLTCPEPIASDAMFDMLLKTQIRLFGDLGLHFKVLEMPTSELGLSAHRKVDIEAWMPGENTYGEISSTSNCLDYQAKRLNIRWKLPSGDENFAYTLNGTACAVPRTIKAILETHQNKDGTVNIPEVLHPFMRQYSPWNGRSPISQMKRLIVKDNDL